MQARRRCSGNPFGLQPSSLRQRFKISLRPFLASEHQHAHVHERREPTDLRRILWDDVLSNEQGAVADHGRSNVRQDRDAYFVAPVVKSGPDVICAGAVNRLWGKEVVDLGFHILR